jgi:hypothetical protein
MSAVVIKVKARVRAMMESSNQERIDITFINPNNNLADFAMALNPEAAAALRVGMTVDITITPVVPA